MIRQGLDAGIVDELHIIVAPVILGGGKRLFEDFTKSLDLENRGVRQSRWATFMEFAVRRVGPPRAVTRRPRRVARPDISGAGEAYLQAETMHPAARRTM